MIYDLLKSATGPVLRSAARLQASGLENVPRSGPVILASNHLSIVDSTFLPLVLERQVTFMAKAEYFHEGRLTHKLTSKFMRGSGQVPVDRDNQRAAVASLDACLAVLERGDIFCIYPEGTRSPDGRLYRARTGVAWLAMKSKAPVIPVAMFGTDRVLPPGRLLPRPAQVRIVFGEPLDLSGYSGRAEEARARRMAAEEITAAIAATSGQEYVPTFATSVKRDSVQRSA